MLVFVLGLYAAATTTNFLNEYQRIVNNAVLVIELALLVYGLDRVAKALVKWYVSEVAPRTTSDLDERLMPIVQRVATGVIYALGLLMIVQAMGLNIAPCWQA